MGDAIPVPPKSLVAAAKLPKSNAFPSVAISIKSITSVAEPSLPPNLRPLTAFEHPEEYRAVVVESPKSDEFPVVDIVTNSIVLTLVLPALSPRKNIPLVGDEQAANHLEVILISPKSNPSA